MRKVVLMIILLSIMSFGGSFKLWNIYFHEDGTHHLDNSKIYGMNANEFASKRMINDYKKKNNVAEMELKKVKKILLLSSNNN